MTTGWRYGKADCLSPRQGSDEKLGRKLGQRRQTRPYTANLNRNRKVLNFVQLGGPKGTVRGTTFELVVPL